MTDILEPVLQQLGEDWQNQEQVTLAQAYVAGKVAEEMLTRIAARRQTTEQAPPSRGKVVIGNIEDDFHGLGRRMVATFLRLDGWEVIDLGNDVAATTFVDTAVAAHSRVIGVSAMMRTSALKIAQVRAEIDRRGLRGRLQLAVGGAIFTLQPALVPQVGADGSTTNALAASALFDRLWQASLAQEGQA